MLSPAQIIFGRQIKDFIPVLPGKNQPCQEWGLIQEDRDCALARRLQSDGSRLERDTRQLKEIPVGNSKIGRTPLPQMIARNLRWKSLLSHSLLSTCRDHQLMTQKWVVVSSAINSPKTPTHFMMEQGVHHPQQ